MPPGINIRAARSEDGARALAIWRSAVAATHGFLTSEDRDAIDRMVAGFLPGAPLTLAVDADDYAIAFMLLDGGHMEALFVDPAVHSRGIGRALVAHALAAQPGLTTDVNEQNPAALAFYLHLGFVQTGRSPLDGQGRPYPLIHLRHGG